MIRHLVIEVNPDLSHDHTLLLKVDVMLNIHVSLYFSTYIFP